MSEEESSLFETRCLEERSFFLRVKAREQLRMNIESRLLETGQEVFANLERVSCLPHKKKRPAFSWSYLKPVWKYAAAAAAFVMLLFLVTSRESYRVNKDLERELGGRTLRSAPVVVLTPSIGQTCGQSVTFSWQTDLRGTFEIIVLNRRAEEIYSLKTKENHYQFESGLEPGLYYWKLIQNGDWIYTGKFKVKAGRKDASSIDR